MAPLNPVEQAHTFYAFDDNLDSGGVFVVARRLNLDQRGDRIGVFWSRVLGGTLALSASDKLPRTRPGVFDRDERAFPANINIYTNSWENNRYL